MLRSSFSSRLAPALALVGLVGVFGGGASCDPVHDHQVDDLGDEAAGIQKGPLHRAGQPCLLCHDGSFGSPPQFTVAGTIYVDANSLNPANGAIVALEGHDGVTFKATANEAGNFYVNPQEFVPTYPMKVAVTYNHATVNMKSLIGRNGSCAGCHADPVQPSSPGHIFVPADGVTP